MKPKAQHVVVTYRQSLDAISQKRYADKLQILDLDQCPYEIDKGNFTDDMKMWPELTYPDLFNYVIEHPGIHTKESMKAYKSLQSYNYFLSGYVHTVFSLKIAKDKVLLRANLNYSQRTSEAPCKVWCAVKKSGEILASHCDCMAGLGEMCSHVAATLFKVEACIRLGYNREACTSVPCKWNATFTKKGDVVPIVDMDFSKPKRTDDNNNSNATIKSRRSIPVERPTYDEQENFFQKLSDQGIKSVVLTCHDELHKKFKLVHFHFNRKNNLPPLISDIVYKHSNTKKTQLELHNEASSLFSSIKVTKEEAQYLESVTRNQADCMIWHEHRVGRISASRVHNVLHTNKQNPANSLLKQLCESSFNSKKTTVPSLLWGIEHEDDAVNVLNSVIAESHSNFTISKCGLFINTKYPYMAASPDRVVNCDCCGKGVVEVKCPYSLRDEQNILTHEDTFFYK